MALNTVIYNVAKFLNKDKGKELAKMIVQDAERRLANICRENIGEHTLVKRYTYRIIYPAIASYQAIRSAGIDESKAVTIIVDAIHKKISNRKATEINHFAVKACERYNCPELIRIFRQ